MNKGRIFWLSLTVGILVAIVGFSIMSAGSRAHRYAITVHTISVGRNLIDMTNSTSLVDAVPGFRADLAALLTSSTRIESVLSGDEAPPLGDGSACSRLILKNDRGQALSLRLHEEAESGRFRLLGYRKITEPQHGADPIQPIRSQ